MSYTKKNTKNSPIKNTNMSENTQTKPNDKCPCGSGKKYKKCCFKNKKVEKKHAVSGECPCCCGGGEKLVGMTIWLLDDTERNYGKPLLLHEKHNKSLSSFSVFGKPFLVRPPAS